MNNNGGDSNGVSYLENSMKFMNMEGKDFKLEVLSKKLIAGSKICIVDDVAENVKLLRAILKERGYKTCVAQSGAQALEVIRENNKVEGGLHLILLDIMMEEMDSGFKLCKELKKDPKTANLPIIFMSARNETSDIVYGLELGAEDYITKPFQDMEVMARVERNLANYHHKLMLFRLFGWLKNANYDTVERLNRAAEYKDNETGNHVKRMSESSRILGLKYGYSPEEAEILYHAAGMHDIGKIGIPDRVLLKPGKLDKEEWKIMKAHTFIGGYILENSKSPILNLGATIATTHHEKFDGSGYPNGLEGDEIDLAGRIVAICDVFDALTSVRPYKEAWPVELAVEYIVDQKGRHFDPDLVDMFVEILPDILEATRFIRGD